MKTLLCMLLRMSDPSPAETTERAAVFDKNIRCTLHRCVNRAVLFCDHCGTARCSNHYQVAFDHEEETCIPSSRD